MQWGQALQLIEDMSQEGAAPVPFVVVEGEWLTLVTRFSVDGVTMQAPVLEAVRGAMRRARSAMRGASRETSRERRIVRAAPYKHLVGGKWPLDA